MVAIQDTELKEGIQEAIKKAKTLSRPILVSEVHKIDHMDPLSFFAAGKEIFNGERFFWKDPSNDTFIIGLGICKQIQSDQATDRFFHVEEEWKRFIQHAMIFNDTKIEATGPLMFGGFSFDPLKEKTMLWSKFSDSIFHIPQFMLSQSNGQSYLTTNIVCTQYDDLSMLNRIKKDRLAVLSSSEYTVKSPVVLEEQVDIKPQEWKNTLTQLVEDLREGTLKKAVLARELRLFFRQDIHVEDVLSNLMTEQRESFIFAFESNGDCFTGASPERLVKKNGNTLLSTCLAGSIARGTSNEEDLQLGAELLSDEKNLSEHQFVVDMIKEAMEEVCGKVDIPNKPELMKMKHIQHLYTPVVGKANQNTTLLQLVDRLHPTPALGGLPKKEAVEKIREIEDLDRGMYAAPIGWLDFHGNGEFAVAIRSGLIQGKEASLFAGCGVVKDSNAESEFIETKIKFRPMLSALGGLEK